MKKIVLIIFIIALIFIISCKEENGDYSKLIIGKWQYTKMVVSGVESDISAVMESYMIFDENGNVKNGAVVDGKEVWTESSYSINDDKLIIDGELDIKKLNKTTLVLSHTENNITILMHYEKVK